jgi:hypothetical protein
MPVEVMHCSLDKLGDRLIFQHTSAIAAVKLLVEFLLKHFIELVHVFRAARRRMATKPFITLLLKPTPHWLRQSIVQAEGDEVGSGFLLPMRQPAIINLDRPIFLKSLEKRRR